MILLYIFQIVVILISTLSFSIHYFVGESSHFQIVIDRAQFFKENCQKAKEEVFETPENVSGVYFGPGSTHDSGIGYLYGYVESGYLSFYETNSYKNSEKPFLRFSKGNPKGVEVDSLESQYCVVAKDLTKDLRKELAIHGVELSIVENSSHKTIATKVFFQSHSRSDVKDKRCGSYSNILFDALNLSKGRYL